MQLPLKQLVGLKITRATKPQREVFLSEQATEIAWGKEKGKVCPGPWEYQPNSQRNDTRSPQVPTQELTGPRVPHFIDDGRGMLALT